jgi:replicative DNA helicase
MPPRSKKTQAPVVTVGQLFEKAPPHSIEMEMALLGACILDPKAIDEAFPILPAEDAFFSESHAAIWSTLVSLRSEKVDILQLFDALKKRGVLEDVGGAPYLEKLHRTTPGPAGAKLYAKNIAGHAKRRRLIKAASEILHSAYCDLTEEPSEIADKALSGVMAACRESGTGRDVSLVEAIDLVIADIGKKVPAMWRTNLREFDEKFGGAMKGSVTTFFGPSGSGKTTFALQLALELSRTGVRTRVFSREQGAKRIAATMMQQMCQDHPVPVHEYLKTGATPTADEWGMIRKARKEADELMNFAIVSDRLDAQQVYQRCAMYKQQGIDLVMIDYIQNLPPIAGVDRGVDQTEEACQLIQSIAVEFGIGVFLISQVTASASREADEKCPQLRDCRGGGAIENISDVAYAVWRPKMHLAPSGKDSASRAYAAEERAKTKIHCAKAKYTARGDVNLRFDYRVMRFIDESGQTYLPASRPMEDDPFTVPGLPKVDFARHKLIQEATTTRVADDADDLPV